MSVAAEKSVRAPDRVSLFSVPVQVAAVCYRRGPSGLEFLLVRTSSGRWIFPKGRIDESLSNCEAAAREAWEEAGARGAIEPHCFHTFGYWKPDSGEAFLLVEAYLLEVLRAGIPPEEHRAPTWFAPAAAKRAISRDRDRISATELVRVIDAALSTIASPTI